MENYSVEFIAAVSQAIAAFLALFALIVSIATFARQLRLQRWELRVQREAEVIRWTSSCLLTLSQVEEDLRLHSALARNVNEAGLSMENRARYRAELSALIDLGRVFFPNEPMNKGMANPGAYRGHRPEVLDPLVAAYDALHYGHDLQNPDLIEDFREARRMYVSEVQGYIDPQSYNRIRN
ncbi:MAG: hypothetical protein AAFV45_05320 [Pseudomonadota bacterium]